MKVEIFFKKPDEYWRLTVKGLNTALTEVLLLGLLINTRLRFFHILTLLFLFLFQLLKKQTTEILSRAPWPHFIQKLLYGRFSSSNKLL